MVAPNAEPPDSARAPAWFEPYAQRLQRLDDNVVTIRAWVVFFGRLAILLLAIVVIEKLGWIDFSWIDVR